MRPSPRWANRAASQTFAEALAPIGDLERILARVALRSARPRDLVQLRASLAALPALRTLLAALRLAVAAGSCARAVGEHRERARAAGARHCRGTFGVPARWRCDRRRLSTRRSTSCDASRPTPTSSCWSWRQRERERSGIAQLKLGYNRVQGFFIEIPRAHAERVPADYLRRQTVKSAERFITPELKRFEDEVLGARDKALAREKELYDALLGELIAALPALQAVAAAIASLDALASLAQRADTLQWVEPVLVDEPVYHVDCRPPPGGGTVQRHAASCPMTWPSMTRAAC